MDLSLVVLAAGIGRRYGGFKQIDAVGPSGEFLVDYAIFDAIRAGFNKVIFVICRDIDDAFKSTVGARVEKHISTDYVFQELSLPPGSGTAEKPSGYSVPPGRKKPWGTGHAVLSCADAINGPFAVVNADDFYGRESFAILSRFLRETTEDDSLYCMVGFVLSNTLSEYGCVARGICSARKNSHLQKIVEHTKVEKIGDEIRCDGQVLSGDELVSMNMWGFKPSIFAHLEHEFCRFLDKYITDPAMEFYMPSVVDKLIVERKASVTVLETGSSWFGVTYAEDKAGVAKKVRDLIESGEYPRALWE